MNSNKRFTRRAFHHFACFAGASMVADVQPLFAQEVQEETEQKYKYIDVHTHLGPARHRIPELKAADLLKWMDKHAVEKAVVLPLVSPESWFYPISTDYVLSETQPHRDRLVPFCSADPRTVNLGGKQGFIDLLKKYQDDGAKGFGEHKTGVAFDSDQNMMVFEACAEVEFPVLFHLDNHRNTDKPGLPGVERVLKAIDTIPFIGHAQGWWASIDGNLEQKDMQGYPKGKVAPGGAIDRLMDDYPNIYGDLSAGSGANAINRDKEFGRSFMIRRADRLLFGTDVLKHNQPIPQFEVFNSLDLPQEIENKIYTGNIRKLLSI